MNRKHAVPTFALMLLLAWIAVVSREARAAGPFQYFAVTPCRAADTRSASYNVGAFLNGTPTLTGNSTRAFFVKGMCGVPGTAKAVLRECHGGEPQCPGLAGPLSGWHDLARDFDP